MLIRSLALLFVFVFAGPTMAASQDVGQIKKLSGDVRLSRAGLERPAKLGEWLQQSDKLVTGADSSVGITFVDNSRFSAGPNTTLELERFQFNPTTHEGEFLTRLRKGTLAVTSGQMAKRSNRQMRIFTPSSVLGVRGTRFLVKVEE